MPLAQAQEPEQPEQPDQVPRNPRVALGHAALRFGLDSADVLVLGERWGPGHRGEKGCEYQLLAHVRPPVCDEDAKRQRIGRDTVPLGERVWLSAKANARTDEGPGVLRDDCEIVSPLVRNANPALARLSPVQAGTRDFSTASVSVETQLFRAVGRIALTNPPP